MYSKAIRNTINASYSCGKSQLAALLRWQFPNDPKKPVARSKFPGPNHIKLMEKAQSENTEVIRLSNNIATIEVRQFKTIERQLFH